MTKVALVAHWDWVLHNFRMPIARALRSAGCEVILVSPEGRYVEGFAREGFRWVRWDVSRRSINPLSEIRAIRDLASIYRDERPDVVHHFTIKPNLYGSIAARRGRVSPVINTFTGMGYVFSDGVVPAAIRRVVLPLMRRSFGRSDVHTIFQNSADREQAVRRRLVPPSNAYLIEGTGVDLSKYRPSPRDGTRVTVLMASRLIREKGVEDLVEAARVVRRDYGDVRFRVAGESDEGNPSAIPESQIAEWEREGVVDFIGHQSDMASVIQDADIAVLPTYYPEGVPRFLLEAGAAGLALIATDIPACRAVIEDGVTGLLVPPRAPSELAKAIAQIAADPSERRRLGAAARKHVESHFAEEAVVDRYLKLYRGLGIAA